MSSFLRFATLSYFITIVAGCDALTDDRLTKLTGAKREIDRVYTCGKIYEEEAVKARVLRDSVKSATSKSTAAAMIEEADKISGEFVVMLDNYSTEDFKDASKKFSKRFTQNEFTELFNEYGSVLKAHCLDLL